MEINWLVPNSELKIGPFQIQLSHFSVDSTKYFSFVTRTRSLTYPQCLNGELNLSHCNFVPAKTKDTLADACLAGMGDEKPRHTLVFVGVPV